jgi:hypothetical protein
MIGIPVIVLTESIKKSVLSPDPVTQIIIKALQRLHGIFGGIRK